MRVQGQFLQQSMQRFFVAFCAAAILLGTLGSVSVVAQEASDTEKVVKEAETEVRAKEMALHKMAAQLEAQQKAMEDQQKMIEVQLEAQQKAFLEQQRQFEEKSQDFQKAQQARAMMAAMRGQPVPGEGSAPEYMKAAQQMEAARAALAQMQAKVKSAPLPENATTRVFALKYGKPTELSRVLSDIVGERGMRTGVDERSNSLIVSADDKTMSIVDALVQRLDARGGETASLDFAETLQVRIVWLLDGLGNREPNGTIVSPQVLQALQQLGFESPGVVSQQVTTLTLDDRNRGRFGFTVPVLINEQHWQLAGNGSVTQNSQNRFAVQFELEVEQANNPRKCRIGGSIFTPLGHYTVMGTSTFVEESDGEARQHLSAFVVYLDRAPEFPAEKPAAEAPSLR